MSPSFLPYDPRWTAKLLRRDVRNLKAKAITKIKSRFARSSKTSRQDVQVVIVELERPQTINNSASMAESVVSTSSYPNFTLS
jgi:hypothetical protein